MAGWLDGHVAVVTGGGSGLGRALVDRFLAEGAAGVVVLERSAAKADALRGVDGVAVVVGDATSWPDDVAAVDAALGTFGRLDVFVANAGIWDFGTGLEAIPGERIGAAFDEVFAVNVKAPLLGARAAAAALRESGGSVVITLSNAAFHPGGGGPLYTASKHALVGVVRQLAYELAPDVRVNGVAPGGMSTDLRGPAALDLAGTPFSAFDPDAVMAEFSPLKFAPVPADYTAPYVLLASRTASRTITAEVIQADTGVRIRGRDEADRRRAEALA